MTNIKKRKTQIRKGDIVVIGASAGGVKALPYDFPAPIFVVQYVAPDSESMLAEILKMVSPLRANHPQNGEKF